MARGYKTGGRQKGTPNKDKSGIKTIVASLLDGYAESGQMLKDFNELEPRERIGIAEKLIQYVAPKLKSVDVDMQADVQTSSVSERLRQLSQDNEQ